MTARDAIGVLGASRLAHATRANRSVHETAQLDARSVRSRRGSSRQRRLNATFGSEPDNDAKNLLIGE